MEGYELPPRPFTAYDPERAYDPHIIAVDIAQIPALEVVSVIDFIADLLIPGDRLFPVRTSIRKAGDAHDNLPESYGKRMSRHFLDALLLDEIALSEASVIYSLNPVSGNNVDRAQLVIDWFQRHLLGGRRHREVKQGKKKPVPVHHHAHEGIDAFQSFLDGMIRELVADLVAPLDNGLYGAERGLELVVRTFQKEPPSGSAAEGVATP